MLMKQRDEFGEADTLLQGRNMAGVRKYKFRRTRAEDDTEDASRRKTSAASSRWVLMARWPVQSHGPADLDGALGSPQIESI